MLRVNPGLKVDKSPMATDPEAVKVPKSKFSLAYVHAFTFKLKTLLLLDAVVGERIHFPRIIGCSLLITVTFFFRWID